MLNSPHDMFYARITPFSQFDGVTEHSNYKPLPSGWVVALADVVSSRQAIEGGRYKDVNMAGVSAISAILNATEGGDYPFTFGGDGALIAIPEAMIDVARDALAAVQAWVEEELKLTLRIAIVPISDIRHAGHDIRVARYAVSPFVTYAMFTGGGTRWADAQMKAGKYGVPHAAVGTRPDLAGLSCRWKPLEAQNGEIVSIIAVPVAAGKEGEFRALISDIIAISAEHYRNSNPVPPDGPRLGISLTGLDREAKATVRKSRRKGRYISILVQTVLTILLHATGLRIGRHDVRLYARDVGDNSDFRKFDDGLKMTLDVNDTNSRRIEELLIKARANGVAEYGMHRQPSALITCFVPTAFARDHIHFIDGADGGYAIASGYLASRVRSERALGLA